MKCKTCGHEISPDSKFCEYCGSPVPQQKQCPKCHAVVEEDEKFCHACGTPLQQQIPVTDIPVNTPPRRDKMGYIIGGVIALVIAVGIGFYIASVRNGTDTKEPVKSPTTVESAKDKEKKEEDTLDKQTTVDESQQDIQQPNLQNTNVPISVFKNFHKNITNHQYQAAYNLLSPEFQQDMPYDGWAQGYGTTISSQPSHIKVISSSDNQVELQYDLIAKDRDAGRIKIQNFRGNATLVKDKGSWKISSIAAQKLGESYQ